MLVYK